MSDIETPEVEEAEPEIEEKVEIPKSLLTKLRQTERQSKSWQAEEKKLRLAADRATELEARLKEIEDSEKSELDKAKEQLAQFEQRQSAWENERRETALQLAVHALAPDLGLADAEVALALINRNTVEYDDTGKPSNLAPLLEELVERKPILLKQDSAPVRRATLDGGSGGTRDASPPLTAEQQEWAKRLGYTDMREYIRDMNHQKLDEWQGAKPAA